MHEHRFELMSNKITLVLYATFCTLSSTETAEWKFTHTKNWITLQNCLLLLSWTWRNHITLQHIPIPGTYNELLLRLYVVVVFKSLWIKKGEENVLHSKWRKGNVWGRHSRCIFIYLWWSPAMSHQPTASFYNHLHWLFTSKPWIEGLYPDSFCFCFPNRIY